MICTFPGCTHPARAKGLCVGHLAQLDRGADLAPLEPRGQGLSALSIRLRPQTLRVLREMTSGEGIRAVIRRILEAATSTG